ncbi:hypothetical protein BESB_018500 [Besnoitia besnoiti]|uniref:C3H1-type domain-containing protein n=1 Tax=Besnoitia besnoiti TaxID=94643 RepID=A0A2A9MAW0_BESBE|nr:hypothetical protein BESB_018500 [Besnoitia besnoiti]PFH32532.1 hypothetical protein BESB_018500 [Besnoitia besnoiti]
MNNRGRRRHRESVEMHGSGFRGQRGGKNDPRVPVMNLRNRTKPSEEPRSNAGAENGRNNVSGPHSPLPDASMVSRIPAPAPSPGKDFCKRLLANEQETSFFGEASHGRTAHRASGAWEQAVPVLLHLWASTSHQNGSSILSAMKPEECLSMLSGCQSSAADVVTNDGVPAHGAGGTLHRGPAGSPFLPGADVEKAGGEEGGCASLAYSASPHMWDFLERPNAIYRQANGGRGDGFTTEGQCGDALVGAHVADAASSARTMESPSGSSSLLMAALQDHMHPIQATEDRLSVRGSSVSGSRQPSLKASPPFQGIPEHLLGYGGATASSALRLVSGGESGAALSTAPESLCVSSSPQQIPWRTVASNEGSGLSVGCGDSYCKSALFPVPVPFVTRMESCMHPWHPAQRNDRLAEPQNGVQAMRSNAETDRVAAGERLIFSSLQASQHFEAKQRAFSPSSLGTQGFPVSPEETALPRGKRSPPGMNGSISWTGSAPAPTAVAAMWRAAADAESRRSEAETLPQHPCKYPSVEQCGAPPGNLLDSLSHEAAGSVRFSSLEGARSVEGRLRAAGAAWFSGNSSRPDCQATGPGTGETLGCSLQRQRDGGNRRNCVGGSDSLELGAGEAPCLHIMPTAHATNSEAADALTSLFSTLKVERPQGAETRRSDCTGNHGRAFPQAGSGDAPSPTTLSRCPRVQPRVHRRLPRCTRSPREDVSIPSSSRHSESEDSANAAATGKGGRRQYVGLDTRWEARVGGGNESKPGAAEPSKIPRKETSLDEEEFGATGSTEAGLNRRQNGAALTALNGASSDADNRRASESGTIRAQRGGGSPPVQSGVSRPSVKSAEGGNASARDATGACAVRQAGVPLPRKNSSGGQLGDRFSRDGNCINCETSDRAKCVAPFGTLCGTLDAQGTNEIFSHAAVSAANGFNAASWVAPELASLLPLTRATLSRLQGSHCSGQQSQCSTQREKDGGGGGSRACKQSAVDEGAAQDEAADGVRLAAGKSDAVEGQCRQDSKRLALQSSPGCVEVAPIRPRQEHSKPGRPRKDDMWRWGDGDAEEIHGEPAVSEANLDAGARAEVTSGLRQPCLFLTEERRGSTGDSGSASDIGAPEPVRTPAKNLGSVHHPKDCRPCAFVWGKGCHNGWACKFCHEEHGPRKKKPMKDQKNLMIIARPDGKLEFIRCSLKEALKACS